MVSQEDGRVFFTIPKLFEVSLCLRGGQKDDGWFFVHVEFLFNVSGDLTGMQGSFLLLSRNDRHHNTFQSFPGDHLGC